MAYICELSIQLTCAAGDLQLHCLPISNLFPTKSNSSQLSVTGASFRGWLVNLPPDTLYDVEMSKSYKDSYL